MKKEHRVFLVQVIIAIVIFIGASSIMKSLFLKDPKAQSYLTFDQGVKEMASSSSALIDSLIANNDLTFDPTSGKLLDKVLNNLKYTESNKILMIGSSQMRAVQGMGIAGYDQMVSRKITKRLNSKYQAYNLSLGNMTTPEKLIMAKKNIEILDPERIMISVTPWDCISDKIRPEVKAIENKTYKLNEIASQEAITEGTSESNEIFPLNVNAKVTDAVDSQFKNIDIYNNRAAMKKWLEDKTTTTLKDVQDVVNKEESAFKTNIPEYWRTIGQDLDNISGWDHELAHEGAKSVKIKNAKSQNSKWLGDDIILKKGTDIFEFEGWSKAENVSPETKLYCLDFQVIFEDDTKQWYYKGMKFRKGTHDWEKVSTKVTFDKKVKAIKPHMLFYGGTGTVWFDNIIARPIYSDVVSENLLPNPGFEIELKERQNLSYSYTDAEWEQIKDNMFSVIDFLSQNGNDGKNALLMTPFWHMGNKTAYPQKAQYSKIVKMVKQRCEIANVSFVDASYILSKDNFGVYTKGSVRDKIDVLHFNAEGHDKLAKFIIKELNL